MRNPVESQPRPHVLRRIDPSQVRRQIRLLPRQRIAPHRHPVHDLLRRRPPNRRKNDHVILVAQVAFMRNRLRVDVVVGHMQLVQRLPPPSLRLRPAPRVHHRNARHGRIVHRHRRRSPQAHRLHIGLFDRSLHRIRAGVLHNQRSRAEMLSTRIERLLRHRNLRVLQRIPQTQQRNLPRIVHRHDISGPADLARWNSRIRHRLHLRLQNRRIRHAHRRHSKQIRKRPPRVVVRMLLRIVRRPVLPVQQRIRNARIRLIHADHVAPRRKRLRLRRIRSFLISSSSPAYL